eukprot:CAMPEP_0171615284 /NCGR_PEP_ID=MMETSP0990-20121206/12807_1 /TAXON_ID=483369 /ORGANISM="non described non described, Strain CCMP2098" /LENGTH=114 /DNA_ID=CAMNT_0012179363 /DNA_START=160 /DNA_END=504 /DNA_ORIENTATION=+
MAVNEVKLPSATEKLQVKAGQTEAAATFILGDEDHTLGNSLRHVLMQSAGTDFCGYAVPHPSEPYVHLRLQTDGEQTATAMLRHGLLELSECCDHLDSVFDDAFKDFESKQMDA